MRALALFMVFLLGVVGGALLKQLDPPCPPPTVVATPAQSTPQP